MSMSLGSGCNHGTLAVIDLAAVFWRNCATRASGSLTASRKAALVACKRQLNEGSDPMRQHLVGRGHHGNVFRCTGRSLLPAALSGQRRNFLQPVPRSGLCFPWESFNLLPLTAWRNNRNTFATQAHIALGDTNIRGQLPGVPRPEDVSIPMPLTDLHGSQREFELLHQSMRRLESYGLDQSAVGSAHELLRSEGPGRFRERIQGYLRSADTGTDDSILSNLDMQLLMHHNILIEDLNERILRHWIKEPELLSNAREIPRVHKELYGECTSFPILCNGGTADDRADKELPATAVRRQLVVERLVQKAAYMDYLEMQQKMEAEGRASSMGSQSRVWMVWVQKMALEINSLRHGGSERDEATMSKLSKHQQILCDLSLPAELLGIITCQTVLNKVYSPRWGKASGKQPDMRPSYGSTSEEERQRAIPFVQAVVAVGEAVGLEVCWRDRERRPQVQANGRSLNINTLMALIKRNGSNPDYEFELKEHIVPVGAALVDMMLSCAYIFDKAQKKNVNVFRHELRQSGRKTVGYLLLEQYAFEQMDLSLDDSQFFMPKHQPMVSMPRPWRPSGDNPEGGFLLHKVPFIRTSNRTGSHLKVYDSYRISRVMNILGELPWRVNKQVLNVMEEAWEKDLAIAELPPQMDPDVKELPENIQDLPEDIQKQHKIERYNATKRKNELQSERPTFKLKLKVAQQFQHAHTLYFPHNLDFRGRAYPVPPHLNHIADDVCRGLLMFAEPKPLGEHGMYWLKISLANLLGKDKLPFQERIDFIDASRDWICDVAKDPLSEANIKRWANADDGPWQALARCMELAEAWSSGDEKGFRSRLPIHLDGSCNGLQHYAALGRDEMGAQAVNLTPSERPQDVYMIVLEVVKAKVHKDADNEKNPDKQEHARKLIELGLLQRKVVKQTIMTICYGVTSVGAKAQVQGRLEEMAGEKLEPSEIKAMAGYLSQLVLKSIDEVFERAMLIKRWFDKVSAIMNKHEVPVTWISPIGLACQQPYRKLQTVTVKTKQQRVTLATKDKPDIDKARQRMGFPPNFVHSLDAAHMMMVAEGCHEHGIRFAGVHDSFWTHPGDAETLNRIIREKFVDLHSRPILQELHEDFRVQLGRSAHMLPDLPEPSTLDLELVKESPYMFD